ncbi:MAG TPA: helix-turn-helix transcriptional regulator, partial [Mycobacterium sp.]|nr:helix-turn-helix transcriptional regulator [Mycobacterium sp.]
TTRFVLGTETGRAIPLGAFQGVVAVAAAHEPAVMLAAAYHALADDDRLLIVVDDAHLLDPLSALLVQQLAENGSTRLIVTVRSGEQAPDAVTALWKERMLLRLDLQPLTRRQAAQVIETVLDGDVDAGAVDRLHQMAAGNPLFLRGLLTTALADGALVQCDGCWRMNGGLRVDTELIELVGMRLATLSADELDVVEIVSTAEVMDWNMLRTLCDPAAAARAERRGAIQLVSDGSHSLVRPGHPVIGEVTRQRCGVARARQLNARLAQHLSIYIRQQDRGSVRADVRTSIQLAQFMMRSDLPPDLNVVVQAAESAITTANLALGEELARFALESGGGCCAAIALANSVSWQGRGQEAESILAAHEPDSADELIAVRWGCLRAANLFFGCGRPDDARAVLAAVRERVPESLSSMVTAMEVSIAFFAADLATALTLGQAALTAEMMPMATVWTAMATAGALALSGRFAEVTGAAERGVLAAEQCESGPHRYSLGLAEVLSYTASGDLDAAENVCRRYAAMTAGIPQPEAIVSALTGRVDLARGRLASACEALRKSLWTMSESLPRGWVMLVASWLTQAEGARGNADAAAAALARAESADGPQVAVFAPELELARAWERASSGQTTSAQDHAKRAAKMAWSTGMYAVEMTALHTAVRFGDRSAAVRLAQLSALLNCPLAEAMSCHARALTEHNADRLDDAADRFELLGAGAMAADAAAHAAREHARDGTRVKELESSSRAHWLASQWELRTPATNAIDSPLPITDREREIATLVGAGLTNREIADRLGVSVRTVDGHLYRIYAKLGIEDRDQLARLIRMRPAT